MNFLKLMILSFCHFDLKNVHWYFFRGRVTHVFKINFKHLPQPLRSFGTLGKLFKLTPCLQHAHAKFQNLTTTPSRRMSKEPRGQREREIMPSIMALLAYALRWRTHSAQTVMTPTLMEAGMKMSLE